MEPTSTPMILQWAGICLLPINTVLLVSVIFRAGRVVQKQEDIDKRLQMIERKCLGGARAGCEVEAT